MKACEQQGLKDLDAIATVKSELKETRERNEEDLVMWRKEIDDKKDFLRRKRQVKEFHDKAVGREAEVQDEHKKTGKSQCSQFHLEETTLQIPEQTVSSVQMSLVGTRALSRAFGLKQVVYLQRMVQVLIL